METTFDFLAVSLFIATAGLFFHRLRSEDPPLAPYMLVSLVCAVSNWLGNNGGELGAICLLTAGAFFLMQMASAPFDEDAEGKR
ncbi:MAG: XrtV sorting system accessory protein [Parvularculaceae bacterium]